MQCNDFRDQLPELLFDPRSISSDAKAHLGLCEPCGKEYASFQSTFILLDAWQAPEPSPYFDQRLAVRLREEAAAPPAGWFELLRTRILFNTGAQFRPMLAGAMAAILLIGGGTFAGVSTLSSPPRSTQVSATVDDLQILDKNDQTFQQMDQLLQDEQPVEDAAPSPRS